MSDRSRSPKSRSASRSKVQKSQLYIGGISRNTAEADLKEAFEKFGKIKDVWIKGHYAFLDYDDGKASKRAIKEMDGQKLQGEKIVVEETSKYMSSNHLEGKSRRGPSPRDKCWNCNKSGHW